MTSFYFFALAYFGCLSILLFVNTTHLVLSYPFIFTYNLAIITNMPVITRSQSRKTSFTEVLSATSDQFSTS